MLPTDEPMNQSIIAIFDLDKTMLDTDSEGLWCKFLFSERIVDLSFVLKILDYHKQYEACALDVREYEEYLIQPMLRLSPDEQTALLAKFLTVVTPHIRAGMVRVKEEHEAQGHLPLLITSSNSFIVKPIAGLLKFEHVLCTEMEENGGRLTGHVSGEPPYQGGKIAAYEAWLEENDLSIREGWFYSDSYNDLPLLDHVDHPVAVTPDEKLRKTAEERGWKILNIKND
jgi:HAD superfamily hydrolase (TIGR01490 family)